jgi:heme-degrading monooxygenase HmoA
MIVRIFDTSVDPGDVERGTQLFRDEVRPAFAKFPGCQGVEMLIGVGEHSGDLVEIAAVSRWDSVEAIESATKTSEYEQALSEIRKLFVQSPIVRHFEAID